MSLSEMMDYHNKVSAELRVMIGKPFFEELELEDRCLEIKNRITHMMVEAGEFLNELPFFKDWKIYERHEELKDYPNYPELREEFLDIFLFFLEATLLMGLSARDLEDAYYDKAGKVLIRERERHGGGKGL